MEFVFAIAIVLGIIAVIAMISNHFEKKRTNALLAIAEELHMEFQAKDEAHSFRNQKKHFKLFEKGRSRNAYNIFRGSSAAIQAELFDYRYTVGSGKNSSTYNQTVAHFSATSFDFPSFEMKPENFFHRVGTTFGMQDIDFEEHPDFSKSYLLQGDNEVAIRNLFDRHMLDFFSNHKGWTVEASKQELIIYKSGRRVSPDELKGFMEESLAIANQFMLR